MRSLTFNLALAVVASWTTFPVNADEPCRDDAKKQIAKRDGAEGSTKPAPKLRSADLELVIPRWNLRDQWTVETVTKRVQRRKALSTGDLVAPIQWRFAVSKYEKSFGDDCVRIEVNCLANEGGHPRSVLWFDRKSFALRRMANEVPTRTGYRVMTVSYVHDNDQLSPVLVAASSIPIAAPMFLSQHVKSFDRFQYQTVFNPEEKALDDIPFSHGVTQSARLLNPEHARQMMKQHFVDANDDGRFAKSLADESAIEVVLKSGSRTIRQLWQQDKPWAVFCDDGYSASRLVSVEKAATITDSEGKNQ